MSPDKVQRVAAVLRRAAERRGVVPYQSFHLIFDRSDRLSDRYAALAEAVRLLSPERTHDYGVLLSLDSGLPGKEFFQRFRRTRPDEYVAVIGSGPAEPTARKRALVNAEREWVYVNARARKEAIEMQVA